MPRKPLSAGIKQDTNSDTAGTVMAPSKKEIPASVPKKPANKRGNKVEEYSGEEREEGVEVPTTKDKSRDKLEVSKTKRELNPKADAKGRAKKEKVEPESDGDECDSHKDSSDDGETSEVVPKKPTTSKRKNNKSTLGLGETTAANKKSKNEDLFSLHSELSKKYKKYIGGHMSMSGGPENAIDNIRYCDGMAFAMFLKNQRRWDFSPLDTQSIEKYKEKMREIMHSDEDESEYGYVLPHGSYLINLANPDKEKRKKSYVSFLDDMKRCEQLGIKLYNFHPGSTVGDCTKAEGIKTIAESINKAIKETANVVVVLENMAGQKNVIGSKFEDLRDIIQLVTNKKRIGVCLDTCHLFAAGYDIRVGDKDEPTINKFNDVLVEFDRIVGFSYLRGIHLNDSKSDLGSGLDRHENIGKGKIGLGAFRFLMNDNRFNNIPIVLETPAGINEKDGNDVWKAEIKLLYSLIQQ